jgi:hypothetical protein
MHEILTVWEIKSGMRARMHESWMLGLEKESMRGSD